MKICIPTENDQGLDARVHGHFGSAPFFALADTDTDQVEMIANRGHRHRHGECSPASHLRPEEIDAVVCSGMGRRAFQSLRQAGIDVYLSDAGTVREVRDAVREEKIRKLTADTACGGRHGEHEHHDHHGQGVHRGSRGRGCHGHHDES